MLYTYYPSPIGELLLAGDGETLSVLGFPQGSRARRSEAHWILADSAFELARAQLDDYFSGQRLEFNLPLAPEGTGFQQQVWSALLNIPYGQTSSYGEVAKSIRRPNAGRAVGAANGANPIPVIIPCHRVIGQDGSLTGFGGGLDIKRWLLAHEQRHCPDKQQLAGQMELVF